MKNLPLTFIILTDRTGSIFEKCLASAQIADEVIIVDNKSQNNWRELAQKYHFKLIDYEKIIKNFSEVRNWAMKSAKNEWVFFLDSDEIINENSSLMLEEIISLNLYDGLYVWRSDIFHGQKLKFGEAGRHRLLRLFKKDLTVFNRSIHEVAKVSGKLGQSEIEIEHFAHESITDFLSRVFGYSFQIGQSYQRNKLILILELLFYPPAKFVLNFLIKLGFMDGYRGLIYALVMSVHSLVVRVSAFEKMYAQNFRSK